MRHHWIQAAAGMLVASTMAVAQGAPPPQSSPQAAKPADNANEVVCEKQEVTGSRISTKRVCMTRAQWAEQRHEDRMEIEKVQTQRGCSKNGC